MKDFLKGASAALLVVAFVLALGGLLGAQDYKPQTIGLNTIQTLTGKIYGGQGTIATTGAVRLANSDSVMWASSAANTSGIRLKSNDHFAFDGGGIFPAGFDFFTTSGTGLLITDSAITVNSNLVTPAATGVRFLCISTAGVVTSQAAACVGT